MFYIFQLFLNDTYCIFGQCPLYVLLLRSLATLRSLHFFSDAGISGVGAEAHAVGELPVPGNLLGNVME